MHDGGWAKTEEAAATGGGGGSAAPGDGSSDDARRLVESWYARMGRRVRGWFGERLPGREASADDLAQRTWAAIMGVVRAGRYDPSRAAMSTFVYAVMHNIWRQHSARLGATEMRLSDSADVETLPGEPGDAVALAELLERVRGALRGDAVGGASRSNAPGGGLTPDEAALLRLVGEGFSDRDLAARLGVSASTANARKRAALAALRRVLGAEGA